MFIQVLARCHAKGPACGSILDTAKSKQHTTEVRLPGLLQNTQGQRHSTTMDST